MAVLEFKQGSVICSEGQPLHNLLFITKGKAEASFFGRPFHFEQGDAIGLCDLSTGSHSHTYTAVTDVAVFSYPYDEGSTLQKLLGDNSDVANLLINSMCRQISESLEYWGSLKREAQGAYTLISQVYPKYESMCKLYALTPKVLPGYAELVSASGADLLQDWVYTYYTGIKELDAQVQRVFFSKSGISLGFIFKGAEDIMKVLEDSRGYQDYLKNISQMLISDSGPDLFALLSELHLSTINIKGADAAVDALMLALAKIASNMTHIDQELFRGRIGAYKESLAEARSTQSLKDAPTGGGGGVKQNLSDSLEVILDYSGCPAEEGNLFIRRVHEFRLLTDKGSSDDTAYRLRRNLTEDFYNIYQNTFMKSLADPNVPTIIKMFLNFGYVDADLAGHENAEYLYSIADSIKGDPENGVYTVCEWLHAIYEGKKEPSRNDFDEDYPAYVRELKNARKIDAQEEQRMLGDLEGKLRFELENVFPIVNKITFGRITTFCPLFAEYNVQRGLEVSMVTPGKIRQVLDEIRDIDHSAYYRETIYTNEEAGIPKEYIHVEVLPDFVLMPNVGVRGAMWQEIEGRVRSTPSRMFMSVFFLNDLKQLLITLTAEFRWEMCKRIQGPRWMDLSDPSLTSEMCDYLQFYKNNRDLSTETKVAIKTELLRAKNTYKTVFVSNYVDWIIYEANGSPRLNKIARKILFNYCPFTADFRERLALNPQYADILKRYGVKVQQKLNHLERVVQKAGQMGKPAPQEILDEMEYVKR